MANKEVLSAQELAYLKHIIKDGEGFVDHVYNDLKGANSTWNSPRLKDGNATATIGYGFTDPDLVKSYLYTGRKMTREEADARLDYEIYKRFNEVSKLPNYDNLNSNMKVALHRLNYAIGNNNLKGDKGIMNALRTNDYYSIPYLISNYKFKNTDPMVQKGLKSFFNNLGRVAGVGVYESRDGNQIALANQIMNTYDPNAIIPISSEMPVSYTRPTDERFQLYLTGNDFNGIQHPQEPSRIQGKSADDFTKVLEGLSFLDIIQRMSQGQKNVFTPQYPDQGQFPLGENHFASGGEMQQQAPSDSYDVNNGMSHEENPYGGVPVSMNPNGDYNYVEEGEVVHKGKVFSNRIINPKTGKPFAQEASKLLNKQKERPNDSITRRMVESRLDDLFKEQELVKQKQQVLDAANPYSVSSQIEEQSTTTPEVSPEQAMSMEQQVSGDQSPQAIPLMDLINASQEQPQTVPIDQAPSQNMFAYGGELDVSYLRKLPVDVMGYNFNSPSSIIDIYRQKYQTTQDPFQIVVSNDKGYPSYADTQQSLYRKSQFRHAPTIASGLQVLTDLTGLTNRSDSSIFNGMVDRVNSLRYTDINPTKLTNQIQYIPIDRSFIANQLLNQANAVNRIARESSGGNPALLNASLLAQSYNTLRGLGDLYAKAEEANNARRMQVAQFNLGVDQYNAQAQMQADQANNQGRINLALERFKLINAMEQAKLANQLQYDQAKAANLSKFITNLGRYGQEAKNMSMSNAMSPYYYTDGFRYLRK